MDSTMDELWEMIVQTCPILMKDWLNCFDGDADAARVEVGDTLNNRDSWTDRSANFLLRLVSDDENGYRDSSGKYKPRVQLALTFVRHMSRSPLFTDFVVTTLNVRGREKNLDFGNHQDAAELERDQTDFAIELTSLVGDADRRGNGILHEAAKSGRCADLERFLLETNVDAPNNIGETALHLAAEFEHAKDVAILLRAGATIKVS